MRRVRPWLLTGGALLVLIAVLVLTPTAFRNVQAGGRGASADPVPVDQDPTPAPAQAPVPTRPTPAKLPDDPLPVSAARIPTVLPHTPEIEARLAAKLVKEGGHDDLWAAYSWILGLYAHTDRCMGERRPVGTVGYFIKWQQDESGEYAKPGGLTLIEEKTEEDTKLSDEDRDAFLTCATEYAALHGVTGNHTQTWALTARFPIEDNAIVRLARGE